MFFAVFVEQDDTVVAFQSFEQQEGFAFLYFVGRGSFLVLECRNDFKGEVGVVAEPFNVDVYPLLEVGLVGFGDD